MSIRQGLDLERSPPHQQITQEFAPRHKGINVRTVFLCDFFQGLPFVVRRAPLVPHKSPNPLDLLSMLDEMLLCCSREAVGLRGFHEWFGGPRDVGWRLLVRFSPILPRAPVPSSGSDPKHLLRMWDYRSPLVTGQGGAVPLRCRLYSWNPGGVWGFGDRVLALG